MLLSGEVDVVLSGENIKYYEGLGYYIPRYYHERSKKFKIKRGTKIRVKIEHLPLLSNASIIVKCDNCNKIFEIKYQSYNKYKKEKDEYFCVKCAQTLYSCKNATKTKLMNSKSFEQWCKDNNRQDVLDRWDYELNDCKPSEISMKTKKKCYFKCPNKIHESELKSICDFTCGCEGSIKCIKCNSFGQFLIDEFGENGIKQYWSDKNIENPFSISKFRNTKQGKVWIKCENYDFHNDYEVACDNFVKGSRCPECNSSKGEKRISNWLGSNNISFIPQKTFSKLMGINQGLLSYDFYLPYYNLLIEYQGKFHDGSGGIHTQLNLERQQEHDKRKREYAQEHNINLFEIWYYDFDRIEEILKTELHKYNLLNDVINL